MTDSRTLLLEYAKNGTESAFRDLVARYIDLVFSTALRQVGGDAHLAQDVAQTVFLHLARKARSLPQGVMLGGWLHQATCNVAASITRSERRRQARERQAAQMNTLQNDSTGTFDHVAPILDNAIGRLADEDRTAVLLKFFERRDFRAVGEALGSSEDAARMRVNRALEKSQALVKPADDGLTSSSRWMVLVSMPVVSERRLAGQPVGAHRKHRTLLARRMSRTALRSVVCRRRRAREHERPAGQRLPERGLLAGRKLLAGLALRLNRSSASAWTLNPT